MTKSVFLFVLLFIQFISIGQEKQSNILFIAVDDLKPNIACFGDSLAITPNIDAIAEKGMVFTNTHCQQAVCAPSRASLLTGRYPDQTKVWDLQTLIRDMNPDILTLPQHFRQEGYQTLGNGKIFDYRSVDSKKDEPSWTLYENPYNNSLYSSTHGKPSYYYASSSAKDTIKILEAEAIKLGIDKRTHVQKNYWPSTENANVDYNAYVDGAIAKSSISLMEKAANSNKPFFLAVGFQRPHLPFNAPTNFWDLYKREDFKLAEFREKATNSPSIAYHNFEELRSYTDIPNSGNISKNKQLELIHAYYASVSYIDFLVGMLTSKLDELGLSENTIIVLWGDHGWHLGDHNLWCKHSNFEEATRSPLVISYPNQPNTGEVYTHPTEFTDIATTLCKLTGIKVPLDFEGESLVPAIENPALPIREGALSQYPRNSYMGYSLRTDRYRYTKWVHKSNLEHYSAELYDYENDPLETINFAQDPNYQTIKNRLDSIVKARIKIPSTQEKIQFRIKSLSEKDTTALKNATINFSDNIRYSNSDGELLLTHEPGSYAFSIHAKGHQTINNELIFKKDTVIDIFLEKETYSVSFKIKGEWNNKEIPNVTVQLRNEQKVTNSIGEVFFNEIDYNHYNVFVELEDGWSQNFSNIEIFSDTTLSLFVAEPTHNVEFNVKNLYSGKWIYESTVTLAELTQSTNSSGSVYFSVPDGKYKATIEHGRYTSINDTVTIISDTLLNYQLSPAISTIKFKLKENTTPVNKATVTIHNEEQVSNNLGNAFFKDYFTFKNYSYNIEKENYKTIQGDFYLINDTIVDIQMEKVETKANTYQIKGFSFWPNPFDSELVLENNSSKNLNITIHNLNGQKVNEFELNEKEIFNLNSDKLISGIYSLTVLSGYNKMVYKIIKN